MKTMDNEDHEYGPLEGSGCMMKTMGTGDESKLWAYWWAPHVMIMMVTCLVVSNLVCTYWALHQMTYPRYMISHVLLVEPYGRVLGLVWTSGAIIFPSLDVLVVLRWRRLGCKFTQLAWLSWAALVVFSIGWVAVLQWDIRNYPFLHCVFGSMYGAAFTVWAAMRSWIIDPCRAESGLPADSRLQALRRGQILCELLVAPVLLAGLPALFFETDEFGIKMEQLALASSFVEHLVFVHARGLVLLSYIPDLMQLGKESSNVVHP